MSTFMSTRPMKSAPPPPIMLTKSQSKSEQLAKAVAESQQSPMQSLFRPDSQWSEGGADVVWSGLPHRDGFISPSLPSPAARSTHTQFSSNTDSSFPEFADANEGDHSDEDESCWEGGDTTMTTMSTMDSGKGLNNFPNVTLKAAPPARPRRKAPTRPLDQSNPFPISDDEDIDTRQSSYGHTRITSIGSSIWAGRGGRSEGQAPPLPDFSNLKQHQSAFGQAAKDRQSVASSVYSQSPAMEWAESPRIDSFGERLESSSGRQGGEFEVLDNNSKVKVGDNVYDLKDGKRRLADGTVVPKMPPMPSAYGSNGASSGPTPLPRSRSKKGRQNRSPILSYADGAEAEERMVAEKELREHGGTHDMEVTSSMGPKLKKNSPAPWEEAGGDEAEVDAPPRSSHEGWGIPSRPSFDQMLPPNMRAPTWARQSMENFRNRNASSGSQSQQQSQYPTLPSSASKGSSLALTSPTKSSLDRSSPVPIAPADNSIANRRSRSKSVSNSAAGVLKGLGLASSAAPASKKTNKFGKALRGMGGGGIRSSSSNSALTMEVKKSQGISSEDYAHLPPSPSINYANVDPFATRSDSEGKMMATSTSNGTLVSPRLLRTSARSPTTPSPLVIQPMADRLSDSNDSHAGTSISGTATTTASYNTGGTSPGLAPASKPDLVDLLVSSSGKYREQSYIPSPPKSKSSNLAVGGATSPVSATSRVSSLSYKRSSETENMGNSSPTKMMQEARSTRSDSATPTAAPSANYERSSSLLPAKMTRGPSSDAPTSSSDHGGKDASAIPSLGSMESVPYKLITLQEARSKQQPSKSSMQTKEAKATTTTSLDRVTSNKSQEQQVGETSREEAVPSRTLKSKKSGFLRMFGKDRGDTEISEEGGMPRAGTVTAVPPMPDSFEQKRSRQPSDELTPLRGSNLNTKQSLAAPALSIRPVSSMFNGFAPGMLEEYAVAPQRKDSNQLSTPVFNNNGRLGPVSPSITVHSTDGHSSRASSQVSYEDALEMASSTNGTMAGHSPMVETSNQRLQAKKRSNSKDTSSTGLAAPISPAISSFSQPRRSIESTRSETSSSLGLVNGFPSTPSASPMINNDSTKFSDSNTAALATATRTKALEIEGKITDLVAELVKLRTLSIENGLVSPNQAAMSLGTSGSSAEATSPSTLEPPNSPSLLQHPIPICSQCGCNCAEQKRLQTLNEMAILKGISVLDRGRALKPLSNGNAGKFGSYVNR